MQCPICANALEGGDLVMVCTPCHRGLAGGSDAALSLNATGEFRAASPELIAAAMSPGERPSTTPHRHAAATTGGEPRLSSAPLCSWCAKGEPEVRKLLGRGSVALCEECVSLCCDILDAELGTWR